MQLASEPWELEDEAGGGAGWQHPLQRGKRNEEGPWNPAQFESRRSPGRQVKRRGAVCFSAPLCTLLCSSLHYLGNGSSFDSAQAEHNQHVDLGPPSGHGKHQLPRVGSHWPVQCVLIRSKTPTGRPVSPPPGFQHLPSDYFRPGGLKAHSTNVSLCSSFPWHFGHWIAQLHLPVIAGAISSWTKVLHTVFLAWLTCRDTGASNKVNSMAYVFSLWKSKFKGKKVFIQNT